MRVELTNRGFADRAPADGVPVRNYPELFKFEIAIIGDRMPAAERTTCDLKFYWWAWWELNPQTPDSKSGPYAKFWYKPI